MVALFPSRPVVLEVFGFAVHWYGVMYLLAFLLAYALLPRLQRHRDLRLSQEQWSNILFWAITGVLLGGRLGYVFFYAPQLLTHDPLEILMVWHGGMSSHGGLIGVLLAVGTHLYRQRIPLLALADTAVVPAALGLALGRMGNFINLELYGTVTDLPWGIAIPGEEGLRHPTQLYAVAKDLAIALLCYLHLSRARPARHGRTLSLFLMLYGVLRFLVEFLRVQDYPPVDLGVFMLTRGQLLTLPVLLAGMVLWVVCGKQRAISG